MNPIHIFRLQLSKTHCLIILPSTPKSPELSFPQCYLSKILYTLRFPSLHATCLIHLSLVQHCIKTEPNRASVDMKELILSVQQALFLKSVTQFRTKTNQILLMLLGWCFRHRIWRQILCSTRTMQVCIR